MFGCFWAKVQKATEAFLQENIKGFIRVSNLSDKLNS